MTARSHKLHSPPAEPAYVAAEGAPTFERTRTLAGAMANRRTVLAGMAAFAVARPARAKEGAPWLGTPVAVSDFKKGSYRLMDSPFGVGTMWLSGSEYNGPWSPAQIIPGSGLPAGGGVPQASPTLFSLLDPVRRGLTAILDVNVTVNSSATGDYGASIIVTTNTPDWVNEWGSGAYFHPDACATDSYLNNGDYDGPYPLPLPSLNNTGFRRIALTLGPAGSAVSVNGSAAHARSRAEYTYAPKLDETWNLLVLGNFRHGSSPVSAGFLEKVTFYRIVDPAVLPSISALKGNEWRRAG
jgi:hypothetical protein